MGEPLRLLWHKDVHMNTVHVSDVCHAVWHACTTSSTPADRLYHVADGADTTLGQLAQLTAEIFEIKFNFVGKTLSMLAKVYHSSSLAWFYFTVLHSTNDIHVLLALIPLNLSNFSFDIFHVPSLGKSKLLTGKTVSFKIE